MDELFRSLSKDARDFQFGSSVPELSIDEITPLSFHRSFVAANQPVVIHNACHHWPAFQKWNKKYFCDKFGEKEVTVAITPNGYADAIAFDPETQKEYFVMPEERKMRLKEFWHNLDDPSEFSGILYLQRQNSNLTEELPEFLEDIDSDIPWATEAFGALPDAINFWVGDGRAITSMHKDPYENIYCVVQGHKDFILLPPTDRPWIPYKKYPTATYVEENQKFRIQPSMSHHHDSDLEASNPKKSDQSVATGGIPWISIDPLAPDLKKYPSYKNASPRHVRVHAGDALFLPSLWYHHVQQSHGCIAVNYWYDMQYDIKYVYHKFLEKLVDKSKNCGN